MLGYPFPAGQHRTQTRRCLSPGTRHTRHPARSQYVVVFSAAVSAPLESTLAWASAVSWPDHR